MTACRMSGNIWGDRFARHLLNPNLASMLEYKPPPIEGFDDLPLETAVELLSDRLRLIHVPSRQECALVRSLLGICHSHALRFYPTSQQFVDDTHLKELTLAADPVTRMVTSEAGLGKTEIANALVRLLGPPDEFSVGVSLLRQQAIGVVVLKINSNAGRAATLNALAKAMGFPGDYRSGNDEDVQQLRRQAHGAGVMLIVVDEFQFITLSANAHAAIAKILHFLRQVGIPIAFIGNFSLGHKLLKRHQEDTHRFLLKPEVILPDAEDDASFVGMMSEFVRVVGSTLEIDPVLHAKMFHWYTGGNRRASRVLVCIAYEDVRRGSKARGSSRITMSDVRLAYESTAFSAYRRDIEICRKQLIENRCIRSDLWCPFELLPEQVEHRAMLAASLQQAHIAYAATTSSMTPEERAGLAVANATMVANAPGLQPPRKARRVPGVKPTVEAMLASKQAEFHDAAWAIQGVRMIVWAL